eukprot:ANDGO_05486.mRNA.1 hypothetical protein
MSASATAKKNEAPLNRFIDSQLMYIVEHHKYDFANASRSMRHLIRYAQSLFPATVIASNSTFPPLLSTRDSQIDETNAFSPEVIRARYAYLVWKTQSQMGNAEKPKAVCSAVQTEPPTRRNALVQATQPNRTADKGLQFDEFPETTDATVQTEVRKMEITNVDIVFDTPTDLMQQASDSEESDKDEPAQKPSVLVSENRVEGKTETQQAVSENKTEPESVVVMHSVSGFSVLQDSLKDKFTAIYSEISSKLPSIPHASDSADHEEEDDEEIEVFSSGIQFDKRMERLFLRGADDHNSNFELAVAENDAEHGDADDDSGVDHIFHNPRHVRFSASAVEPTSRAASSTFSAPKTPGVKSRPTVFDEVADQEAADEGREQTGAGKKGTETLVLASKQFAVNENSGADDDDNDDDMKELEASFFRQIGSTGVQSNTSSGIRAAERTEAPTFSAPNATEEDAGDDDDEIKNLESQFFAQVLGSGSSAHVEDDSVSGASHYNSTSRFGNAVQRQDRTTERDTIQGVFENLISGIQQFQEIVRARDTAAAVRSSQDAAERRQQSNSMRRHRAEMERDEEVVYDGSLNNENGEEADEDEEDDTIVWRTGSRRPAREQQQRRAAEVVRQSYAVPQEMQRLLPGNMQETVVLDLRGPSADSPSPNNNSTPLSANSSHGSLRKFPPADLRPAR